MREVSYSCPGALEPPGYYKERGESLHLQDQDGDLGLHQIQAPSLDLPAEAVVLEEEGGQKGTANGGVLEDHRQFVELWRNLGKHRDWFAVGAFWVWVFS